MSLYARRSATARLTRVLAMPFLLVSVAAGCTGSTTQTGADSVYDQRREAMVKEQIEARGIADARVLAAMRKVPRHLFVAEAYRERAYEDHPLPIGLEQTISQPYIVALMTEKAEVGPDARALEIGTGSGYQAAVLSELAKEVYTIELLGDLAESAAKRLKDLGYENVEVREGDGYKGWKEKAPFDAIIVTAGAPEVPPALVEQLGVGGKMVIPVGPWGEVQDLVLLEKTREGEGPEEVLRTSLGPVRFVPLVKPGEEAPK